MEDKEYYLKATTVLDVSSPDDLLGISSVKLQLYINDESYDISSNPYVKLDTNRFSDNLNFRIEKYQRLRTPVTRMIFRSWEPMMDLEWKFI